MTPTALQQLLVDHLPSVPGIEAAVPWPGRPCGVAVTATGAGTVFWTITGASNTAPAAEAGERLAEQPAPDLPGGTAATAEIEQALLTALQKADSDRHFVRARRYSTQTVVPAVGYGATVDCTDGWRLFLACVL